MEQHALKKTKHTNIIIKWFINNSYNSYQISRTYVLNLKLSILNKFDFSHCLAFIAIIVSS